MTRYFSILLLCLGLVACNEETASPVVTTPSGGAQSKTYLALGDSYTIGQSAPPADQWGMHLANLLRGEGVSINDPVTIARTGWTTAELANAISEANLQPTYDLVSLLIGVNNQYRGQSLATYRTEFSQLLQASIRLAKGNPQHVLVLSIPDWGATPFGSGSNRQQITAEINAFNAAAKEIAQKEGVAFINITPLSRKASDDASYVASDGLHYTGKMYREWAMLALPEAKKALQ